MHDTLHAFSTMPHSVLKGEGNIVASVASINGTRSLLEVDKKTAIVSQAGWAPFNEPGGQVGALPFL